MGEKPHYIRWFNELSIGDVPLVGGKNASLGEMYRELTPHGLEIPNGFAVTAEAYRYLVKSAGILPEMDRTLAGIDKNDLAEFAKRGQLLRELICRAPSRQTWRRRSLSPTKASASSMGRTQTWRCEAAPRQRTSPPPPSPASRRAT